MPRSGYIYLTSNALSLMGASAAVEEMGLLLLESGHRHLSLLRYPNDTANLFVPYDERCIRSAVIWADSVRRNNKRIQCLGSLALEAIEMPESLIRTFTPADITHIAPSPCHITKAVAGAFRLSAIYTAKTTTTRQRGWYRIIDTADAALGHVARACGMPVVIVRTSRACLTYIQLRTKPAHLLRSAGWQVYPLDRRAHRVYQEKFGTHCVHPYPPLHEYDYEEITSTADADKEETGNQKASG